MADEEKESNWNPLARAGGKFASGAFGKLAEGMGTARESRNRFSSDIAMEKNLDPNRRLGDALARNKALNLQLQGSDLFKKMQEGGGLAGHGQPGMSPADFNRGLAMAYMGAATQGINPMLQKELGNIAGIPGLTIEGKEIAPDIKPDIKGPGFGEVAFGGLSSLFGG